MVVNAVEDETESVEDRAVMGRVRLVLVTGAVDGRLGFVLDDRADEELYTLLLLLLLLLLLWLLEEAVVEPLGVVEVVMAVRDLGVVEGITFRVGDDEVGMGVFLVTRGEEVDSLLPTISDDDDEVTVNAAVVVVSGADDRYC